MATTDRESLLSFIKSLPEDMPLFLVTPKSKREIVHVIAYAQGLEHQASRHGALAQAEKMVKYAGDTVGWDNVPDQRVGGKSTRDMPQVPPMSYWDDDAGCYVSPGDENYGLDAYHEAASRPTA